ncbi:hypothetical protein ABW21_db0208897 [Orbilia brochopaga]|nr:hypothetical protein ABW21_db0208897 [Drechslerella brochopaga]
MVEGSTPPRPCESFRPTSLSSDNFLVKSIKLAAVLPKIPIASRRLDPHFGQMYQQIVQPSGTFIPWKYGGKMGSGSARVSKPQATLWGLALGTDVGHLRMFDSASDWAIPEVAPTSWNQQIYHRKVLLKLTHSNFFPLLSRL